MKVRCLLVGVFILGYIASAVFAGEFFDDFDDNNIDDWEDVGDEGELRAEDGHVFMGSNSGRIILLAPESVSVKNFTATVDINVVTFCHGPFVFRYQDPQNFYGVEQRAVKMRFKKGDEGFDLKDDVNQIAGQYVTYKLVAQNDTFTVFIDDEEIMELIDSSISEPGRIGLAVGLDRQANVQFSTLYDNFSVESDEIKGSAVDAMGKISAMWGRLKSQY